MYLFVQDPDSGRARGPTQYGLERKRARRESYPSVPLLTALNAPESSLAYYQIKDGFLHLSTSAQLALTLERFFNRDYFPGDELFIGTLPRASIDKDGKFKFDESHGDRFGHVYGVSLRGHMSHEAMADCFAGELQTIDPSKDFEKVEKITRGPDGKFRLPEFKF